MERFRALTLSYCLACLAAGAVREMIPDGESRKVIKTLSGLYILLAVLHALGAAGPLSLPAVSLPAAAPAAESDYTAAILARAQENLEAGCSSRLAELGLPCVVRMELACTGDTVEVKRITLCCETALSPEQVQQAEAIARSYGANAVVWADKAAEP